MDIFDRYSELKRKSVDLECRVNIFGWPPFMVEEARVLLEEVNKLEEDIQKYIKDNNIK